MTEKFDLKCATSLLPRMNGTEDVTKQLIDSVEMYGELLDESGQELLINFVLKTRVSQSAKLRLCKTYPSVAELLTDMRTRLLTRKSAAVLASELHRARQGNKSIDEFGRTLEELLVNLTMAQANGDNNMVEVLTRVNEKLAINVFANGLRDKDLQVIVKARSCELLKDAVMAAKEEETSRASIPAQQFHFTKRNQNRGSYPNNGNYSKGNKYNGKNNNWQQSTSRRPSNNNGRKQNNAWSGNTRQKPSQHAFVHHETANANNSNGSKFFRGQQSK